MAFGIDNQVLCSANSNNTIFTAVANKTLNIRIINTNATAIQCGLAISATATPASNEWIAPLGMVVAGNGMAEEIAIPVQSGKYIVAYPNSTGVIVSVWGV